MLDLAISINTDSKGTTVIETNRGEKLKTLEWPQDCDFQLVAFSPSGTTGGVVWTEDLVEDIGRALTTLDRAGALKGRKPNWYRRLEHYTKGASSLSTSK